MISAIVFLAGCNFRCHYCHASHLVLAAAELERIPLEVILKHLSEKGDWLDGVVISGGEPTLYGRLEELIDRFRDLGLAVRLDTNGTRPDVLESLVDAGRLDCVALDVKAPLDERYAQAVAADVDLTAIRRSIDFLLSGVVDYEFRTTVCSELLGEDDIRDMSRQLVGAKRWVLQPFRPLNCIDPAYRELDPMEDKELAHLAAVARQAVTTVCVRGASDGAS